MMRWIGEYEYWVACYRTTYYYMTTIDSELEWWATVHDTQEVFRHANQLEF